MSETGIEVEDLTGLVSPEGINLDDAELASTIPLVCLSLAVGTTTDVFSEYVNNPMNSDTLPLLERFQSWIKKSISDVEVSSHDDWLNYLATSRAESLTNFWTAYDPDGFTVDEPVRDVIGDELLGTALFFQFLESVGLVTIHDSQRWMNVWHFRTFSDLLDSDDEENVSDQPISISGDQEW
jgi:hypothetical protein